MGDILRMGAPVNFSGLMFRSSFYGLHPKTNLLDYNHIEESVRKQKPKVIVAGHSAYPRMLDFKIFREIADRVQATLLVDMAHFAGLVAGGAHPSPIPHAHFVTSTTHKTLRGPRGGLILCSKENAKKIDKAIFPGIQGGPLMHIIAGKAVAFKSAQSKNFKEYAHKIILNSKALAKALNSYGFSLITGGTDNHLVLIDLSNKNITGKKAEWVLEEAGITVNKNTVPGEKLSPFCDQWDPYRCASCHHPWHGSR